MRGFSIKLAVLATALLWFGRADALVIDFDTLAEGTIVENSDLPSGFTISVNNRNSSHPDEAIIFDSACPPGNVGTDCSGQDPDLLTPGGALGGIGNDTAQNKILIIPEDIVDTTPANGLVDDPDDELRGGTITFTLPAPDELRSVRLIDIDNTEGATQIVLQLAGGGTQMLTVVALGNNSGQTIVVPDPVPSITGFTIDCAGSCGIDDIVIGEEVTTTTCTSTTTSTTSTSTTTSSTTTTSTTTTTIPPRCGDGKVDPGEQCDEGDNNSDEPDATCRTNCTPKRCGDGILDTGEDCDEGDANSNAPNATCRLDCTLPRCGDGVVDDGEFCDAGTANSSAPNAPCRPDCTLPFCGDGILDTSRGELCDPPPKPNAENCANQLDDDGDGLIDCADSADCPEMVQKCGFDCKLAMCTPVRRDPAIIRFNSSRSGSDMFWVHGNFRAAKDVDFTTDRFAIILSNENGVIYQGTLVPGEFKRRVGGKGRFVFRDRDARSGGQGDADGIYRATLRERLEQGHIYVYFRLRAFGDFSSATVPTMTTQIAAGDHVGTLTAEWRRTGYGWVLKQRYFGEVE
jgi:hypothetical protein